MLKAKDIMETKVITVTPETTVEELGRLFIQKGISGAPVLDADNKLYGIVTENDLIKQNKRIHDSIIPLEGFKSVENEIKLISASTVSEICTKKVITVNPETSLQDIATIMYEKGVHLIPVLSSEKLVGIIGKIDVIKGTLSEVP
jgi:CBS-domain-containing membrane protein